MVKRRERGAQETELLLVWGISALPQLEEEEKLLGPSWSETEGSWRTWSSRGFSLNRGSSHKKPATVLCKGIVSQYHLQNCRFLFPEWNFGNPFPLSHWWV